MKKLAKLSLTFVLASYALSMDCVGSKRYIDERGQSQTKEIQLERAFDYTDAKVHADIQEAYFVFTKYDEEKFIAKITFGPEYTRGIVATATFDQNNRFELAGVEGGTVYKLVCLK